jgi:hypothetical protein|tara:strand:- start:336 stop:521 length:186 start_codon:yes stop_codon:yes gene_type:complete
MKMSDILEVIETPDGDFLLEFSPELCEELGWREGDILDWRVKGSTVILSKVNDPEGYVPVE